MAEWPTTVGRLTDWQWVAGLLTINYSKGCMPDWQWWLAGQLTINYSKGCLPDWRMANWQNDYSSRLAYWLQTIASNGWLTIWLAAWLQWLADSLTLQEAKWVINLPAWLTVRVMDLTDWTCSCLTFTDVLGWERVYSYSHMRGVLKYAFACESLIVLRWPWAVDRTLKSVY